MAYEENHPRTLPEKGRVRQERGGTYRQGEFQANRGKNFIRG